MTDRQLTPAQAVYRDARRAAMVALAQGDPERSEAAAARVALAFQAAASGAPKPEAWRGLDPASIAACVGASIATDLYPGGAMAPVYLVPQGGQLQWRITHRGLCELARRDGYHLRAVPVGRADELEQSFGLVTDHRQVGPRPSKLADLAGVIVVVRHMTTRDEMAFFVDHETIDARRRSSRMSGRGPWVDWPIEMAIKTSILYLAARGTLPISTGLRDVLEAERVTAAVVEAPEPTRRGKALITQQLDVEPEQAERREPVEVDLDAPPPAEWAD